MTDLGELWFLREDLDDLDQAISDVQEQIRQVKREAQEGTEQSSESWHDNYIFEEAQRQLKMLMNHLGGLSRMRERARLHPLPAPHVPVDHAARRLVSFGDLVTLHIDGEPTTARIGSAMVFDRMRELGYISYQSPLAEAIAGKGCDDTITTTIAGQTRTIVIVDIAG